MSIESKTVGDKRIDVDYDQFAENPLSDDCYLGSIYSFSTKHTNFRDVTIEDNEPTSDAVLLSYFEHGTCKWFVADGAIPAGVEFQWDGVRHAGFWEPNADILEEMKALKGTKRAEAMKQRATEACEAFTAWASGEVYEVRIYEVKTCDMGHEHDELIDSCSGFYSIEEAMESGLSQSVVAQ